MILSSFFFIIILLSGLVVGQVGHHLAVECQHVRLADESHERALGVHHGKRPSPRAVEREEHHVHGVVDVQPRHRFAHQLAYLEAMVEFLPEHDGPHVVQVDDAHEPVLAVHHGEHVAPRGGDALDQLAQVHVRIKVFVVFLDDRVEAHQGEHGAVLVVREQLPFLGQPHGIDAVRLKRDDGQVGTDGHNHQGHEQLVAAREFGNEENARQRGVHHAAHQAGHADHGKVALGQVDVQELVDVPQAGEDEARDAAQEQAGGEDSAAAPAAIGGRGGEHLEDEHQGQIEQEQVAMAVEERTVHRRVPVGRALSVEKQFDKLVAFTVERREKIDEDAQHGAADEQLHVGVGVFAEHILQRVHRAGEVERHEAAEDAQQDVGRDFLHGEGVLQVELEDGAHAGEGERDPGRRDARDKQGKQRTHGEVDHEHLEREHQPGDGRLEDARHGAGRAAAHQQHERLAVHPEKPPQVGADGRTREHNGRLGSHRTAEADGDGAGDDARPCVVRLDFALLPRYGEEDFGYAMADVVLHDVADEKPREEDADDGVNQVERVGGRDVETVGQHVLDLFDEPLQEQPGKGREHAHEEADDQDEFLFTEIHPPPDEQPLDESEVPFYRTHGLFAHFLMMVISPSGRSLMMLLGADFVFSRWRLCTT